MASIAYVVAPANRGVEVHWFSFSSNDDCDPYPSHNARDVTVQLIGATATGKIQMHGAWTSGLRFGHGPGSFMALEHFSSGVNTASLLNSGVCTLLSRVGYLKPVAGTTDEVTVKITVEP